MIVKRAMRYISRDEKDVYLCCEKALSPLNVSGVYNANFANVFVGKIHCGTNNVYMHVVLCLN